MTTQKQLLGKPEESNFKMLRSLFDEMYSEINEMKKKKPEGVVNSFKVKRINKILLPLHDLMKEEPYGSYLELIPNPIEEKVGRSTVENGLTYSDVMLILSQYKSALSQFYRKYFYTPLNLNSF